MIQLLAHRGLSGHFPDNSLLAFQRAYQVGAAGVELDVQLTKDGQLVLFHDFHLEGCTHSKGRISDYIIEDLEKISYELPTSAGLGEQKILSLTAYLDWVKDKDFLTNFELKLAGPSDGRAEDQLLDQLVKADYLDRSLISSFELTALDYLKAKELTVPLAYLVAEEGMDALEVCRDRGFNYLHPHIDLVNHRLVQQAKAWKIGLNVWTVNDYPSYLKLVGLGVDGLITDYPDRFLYE